MSNCPDFLLEGQLHCPHFKPQRVKSRTGFVGRFSTLIRMETGEWSGSAFCCWDSSRSTRVTTTRAVGSAAEGPTADVIGREDDEWPVYFAASLLKALNVASLPKRSIHSPNGFWTMSLLWGNGGHQS